MISRAEAEKSVGMEWYSTRSPPCRAQAKVSEEDFRVEEELSLSELSTEWVEGRYPLYRVEKRAIDTLHMAGELSAALRSRVSYAGLKDRRAVAVQYATPKSSRCERPAEVLRDRFTATLVGYLPRPLSRASLIGNRFEVTLRGCCARVGEAVDEALRTAEERRVPNFYGLQRFGAFGAGTHRIGRAIVKREFREAVTLMLSSGLGREEAKRAMEAGRYEELARLLPRGSDVERGVAMRLERRPADWLGALRTVPIALRRLYVHAYQSAIFNRTLSVALGEGEDISLLKPGDNWAETRDGGFETSRVMGVHDQTKEGAVPMVQVVGYAFRDYGSRFDACARKVLDAEDTHPRDFYVQEMQEVSAEGGFRRPHLALRGGSSSVEGETALVSFTLARGQYATVLLREIVKPTDPIGAGLG